MKPIFIILTALVLLSLLAGGVSAVSEPMPMETDTEISEPMPMENETDPSSRSANGTAPIAHLDEDVRIIDWSYESEVFTIVFEADSPTHVTISEATQSVEGVTSFTTTRERVLPGENRIRMEVTPSGGEAQVSITSAGSLRENRGLILSTGQVAQDSPFDRTSSTAGWFGGAGTVAFMVIVVTWRTLRREPDAPEVVES